METTDNQCTSKLAELRQHKFGLRSQYRTLLGQVAFLDECGRKAQHRLAESQRVTSAMRSKRDLVEEMQGKKTEYGMWMDSIHNARLEKIEEERKRKEALKEKKMDLFELKRKEVGETRQAIVQLKTECGMQRNEYEKESRTQAQQLRDQHEQRLGSITKVNTEARNSLYERRRQERNDNEAVIKQRVAEQQQKNAVQAHRVRQEEKRVIDNVRSTVAQQNRQKMEHTMQDRLDAEEAEIDFYSQEVEKLKDVQRKARKRVEESEKRLRITTNTENPFLAGPSSPLRLPRS